MGRPSTDEETAAVSSTARIDLHCHSRFSARSDLYLARTFGMRECFTDPHLVYREAKARGMTHVTLTDHDTIEGALQLAGYPDFVIGEEVSAFFPTEALHVHVLVWGIDEARHREINELRFNIFELADYLRAEHIPHALAHPLSVVSELRPEHYAQLMLLFGVWETRNGSSTPIENQITAELVAASAALIPTLAKQYERKPAAAAIRPIAGSDDHGGLDVGGTYTQIRLGHGETDPFAALMRRKALLRGTQGSTAKTAHTAISLLVQGGDTDARNRLSRTLVQRAMRTGIPWSMLEGPRSRHIAGRVVGLAIDPPWRREGPAALRRAAASSAAEVIRSGALVGGGIRHDQLAAIAESAWERTVRESLKRLRKTGFFRREALDDWKSLGQSQALIAPYLLAATSLARQRVHATRVHAALADERLLEPWPTPAEPHVAMFTDTFEEINGVAAVLQPLVEFASDKGWPLTMVSCGKQRISAPTHETFEALDRFGFDVYEEFPLFVPPVLQLLRWCEDSSVDIIHAATPGPMGMIAAILARTLSLPFVASYHTDLPRLGFFLTSDHIVREALWSYVKGFYNQAEVIFCPSRAVQDDLVLHGVRTRFENLDQAIDAARFMPGRRSDEVRRVLGGGKKVVLWVGRMSPEKGLDFLALVYGRLLQLRDDAHLVLVGDGPYREELTRLMPTASFLGYRTGDELATIYASCDLFVFPGRAETFGQVLLEAAASGLPSVVTAGTGVDENVADDETALVVPPGDANGFVAALERLLDDDVLRQKMGLAARDRALQRSWPTTFAHMREVYRTVRIAGSVGRTTT
jgi:glycosyltransferase involved in cell wall biosynthesis/predicted metal-dependent phosphoesterase TrpH